MHFPVDRALLRISYAKEERSPM